MASVNRSMWSGALWKVFQGAGTMIVLVGGIFWTVIAGADATSGVGGLLGAVAGYAALLLIVVGLLYSRHRTAFGIWADARVADRLRDGEEVAVTGRLDVDPVEGLHGDRVAGFEYHLCRERGNTGGEDVASGWAGSSPLVVDVGGDRIAVDPAETDVHVDGDGDRISVGFERTPDGIRETTRGSRMQRFVDDYVGDEAFEEVDEVMVGSGLKGNFRLRYWPLAADEQVYLLGSFERVRPGEPFHPASDAVVVGSGPAEERADAVTTRRRRYRFALIALGCLFVMGSVGQAVLPAVV